ncbi:MAG: hypothetical protein HY611_09060 [Elusimicrobia bacterium]|nr:hypothetical protein [Elusimicrobiota bacterium]
MSVPKAAFFGFAIFLFCPRSPVQASCGAMSCPVDTAGASAPSRGSVELGYEFEFIPQDKPRVGRRSASVGEIGGHHDEVYTVSRVHRLRGAWEPTDRWSFELQLPFVSRAHQHIHHHSGQDILDTWSLRGLGDLKLQGRYFFWKPEDPSLPALSALAAVKLPTGRGGLKNADGDEAEGPIQPGSGSTDLTVGIASLQRFPVPMAAGGYGTLPFFVSAGYRINGEGKEDYRVGNVVQANAGLVYPVLPRLGLMAQANLRINGRDGRGTTREEVEKTGGTYLFLSPGIEFKAAGGWRFYALAQFPAYQWVQQIQLVSAYSVLAGAAWRFGP